MPQGRAAEVWIYNVDLLFPTFAGDDRGEIFVAVGENTQRSQAAAERTGFDFVPLCRNQIAEIVGGFAGDNVRDSFAESVRNSDGTCFWAHRCAIVHNDHLIFPGVGGCDRSDHSGSPTLQT